MGRDYAKRPHKKRKGSSKSKGSKGWMWLLTGLLMGIILAVAAYFKMVGGVKTPKALEEVFKQPLVQKAAPQAHHPKPKYEFYSLLPKMEVEVQHPADKTQPVASKSQPSPPPSTASASVDKAKFRLQLASFRQFNDADSLKARLTLEGYKLEIAAITLPSGEIWYRVRTPVLSDRTAAVAMQKKLQKQSVPSIVVKAESEG